MNRTGAGNRSTAPSGRSGPKNQIHKNDQDSQNNRGDDRTSVVLAYCLLVVSQCAFFAILVESVRPVFYLPVTAMAHVGLVATYLHCAHYRHDAPTLRRERAAIGARGVAACCIGAVGFCLGIYGWATGDSSIFAVVFNIAVCGAMVVVVFPVVSAWCVRYTAHRLGEAGHPVDPGELADMALAYGLFAVMTGSVLAMGLAWVSPGKELSPLLFSGFVYAGLMATFVYCRNFSMGGLARRTRPVVLGEYEIVTLIVGAAPIVHECYIEFTGNVHPVLAIVSAVAAVPVVFIVVRSMWCWARSGGLKNGSADGD